MPDSLLLRPLRVEDAEVMAAVLADPSLYRFTGGEPPCTPELERRYTAQVRGHSVDRTEVWLNRIVVSGPGREPVGYVQATIPRNGTPTEIAWVIGKPWQGRGFAGRAAELLVADLAGRGVQHLRAHIHPDHEASERIARRLGLAPTTTVVDGEVRWEGRVPDHDAATGHADRDHADGGRSAR